MPNIGPTELIILLVIVLVIFGPKRLPGLGRSLGSGMREFKDSVTGGRRDEDDEAERPELEPGAAAPAASSEGAPRDEAPRDGDEAQRVQQEVSGRRG